MAAKAIRTSLPTFLAILAITVAQGSMHSRRHLRGSLPLRKLQKRHHPAVKRLLSDRLGSHVAFTTLAVLSGAGFVVLAWLMPETKAKNQSAARDSTPFLSINER
jgi:hypothetical protein